jgi:hypothetical protein
MTDFTTTREKSGDPGAVFRNGVEGLYRLKKILYGDDVSTRLVCNGTAWPAGKNRRDLKIEAVMRVRIEGSWE